MPIIKNAEQIGTMTLEDGRVIPRYDRPARKRTVNIRGGTR